MSQEAFPQVSWTTQVFPAAARAQEAGLKPLKAKHRIGYNPNQEVRGSVRVGLQRFVEPGSLFMPVSAIERQELLGGQYPAAVEPSAVEIEVFGA